MRTCYAIRGLNLLVSSHRQLEPSSQAIPLKQPYKYCNRNPYFKQTTSPFESRLDHVPECD